MKTYSLKIARQVYEEAQFIKGQIDSTPDYDYTEQDAVVRSWLTSAIARLDTYISTVENYLNEALLNPEQYTAKGHDKAVSMAYWDAHTFISIGCVLITHQSSDVQFDFLLETYQVMDAIDDKPEHVEEYLQHTASMMRYQTFTVRG